MNIFNQIKVTEPARSMFDLSHDVKLSCNMGQLVPVLNMDCIPGDKVQLSGETLVRFAPLLAPVMHLFNVFVHYFFCPWRILWPNFEKFISGRNLNPAIITAPPQFPVIDWMVESANPGVAKLGNYLGVPLTPPGAVPSFKISAMPFAVYRRIWFEYYRDQNFQDPEGTPWLLSDGLNGPLTDNGQLMNRAWEHDYFTSALPWAQKGPSVHIPMATAPGGTGASITQPDGSPSAATNLSTSGTELFAGATPVVVNSGTINDLRKAHALQRWLETNARAGTRYKETILGHFGVDVGDDRLQRPEYICGLKTPVVISQVLQTSGTLDAPTPLGTMGGHGAALSQGDEEYYSVKEHGTIMGILSIMPKTAYQQGLHRSWLKTDYLDFGWHEFAHIGEQGIDLNEIYAFMQEPDLSSGEAWGYIPRYAEYKFMGNRVCGDFQTNLNYWTAARIFTAPPGLNDEFIVSDPTTRIFAVTDTDVDHMYVQILHNIQALRPLPKFGTPS